MASSSCRSPIVRGACSYFGVCVRQRGAQLLGGAKQRILGRFLAGVQRLSNGAQPQALVVLHLKDKPLARRQFFERQRNASGKFAPHQVAFGTGFRTFVGHLIEQV